MKILNLYAGIGGNRKLWGEGHEITAVEYREDIANVYRHYFPNDKIIVADAHEYLLENYQAFDFIWTSTPCPTWSRANFWASKTAKNRKKYYPDMKLYQEIIFLTHWTGDNQIWVVENVVPYCEPLMKPHIKIGRHLFWSNFEIYPFAGVETNIHAGKRADWSELHGFDLSNHEINSRKDQIYRNCVHPETGLHILNCAIGKVTATQVKQSQLF